MNQETIQPGATVYDLQGNAAEFFMKHPTLNGAFVEPLFEGLDSETGPYTDKGDVTYWPQVFLSPPTQRKAEEVVKLEERIAILRGEVSELQSLKYQFTSTEKEVVKKMQRLAQRDSALTRIEDFLDGRLTHLVKTTHYKHDNKLGNKWVIVEMKDMKSGNGDDAWDRNLRLLTLFGKTEGDLEWYLHRYSDGSGCGYETVIPCCSYEEAVDLLRQKIEDQLAVFRSDPAKGEFLSSIHASLTDIGDPVPQDVRDALTEREGKKRQAKLQAAQDAIDKAREEIQKLTSTPE